MEHKRTMCLCMCLYVSDGEMVPITSKIFIKGCSNLSTINFKQRIRVLTDPSFCTLSPHSKKVLDSRTPRWMDATFLQNVLHSLQLWLPSVSGRGFPVQMVLSGLSSGGKNSIRYPWVYKVWVFALELDPWIYSVYRKKESEIRVPALTGDVCGGINQDKAKTC